jgi:CBS domain-containing protein
VTQAELETHLPELFPSHLMQREVVTTWPDEALDTAAQKLFEHHIHRLVVTAGADDGTPVGILSMTDLARLLPEAADPGRHATT